MTMGGRVDQLPGEMFSIIQAAGQSLAPRLGRLTIPGRRLIETPHYLGNSSRGVVPHITQDTFRRDTHISSVYAALEDFIERDVPPLYNYRSPDGGSSLRSFIALPEDTLLVLGTRRTPPVAAPPANSNTDTTVSVCTLVGFRLLEVEEYPAAAEALGVDILVAVGDIPYGRTLGNKRIEKATDRQIHWLQDHVSFRQSAGSDARSKLFAPLLPVSCAKQQFYVDTLREGDVARDISGLAIYDIATLEDLPDSLSNLPRLGFTTPSSPSQVLRHVALGLDLLTVPFINDATDAGIALDFHFPAPLQSSRDVSSLLSLGIDMWSSVYATDLSPLSQGCQCYACTNHHKAYVQHLLAAKEMLGWVLLQIHNHHVMDLFFEGIRRNIAGGTFAEDVLQFEKVYESRLPGKTGQGPRVRGYQYKSEGPGETKRNKAPFQILDAGKEKLVEAAPPSADVNADELQEHGFAEKQSGDL